MNEIPDDQEHESVPYAAASAQATSAIKGLAFSLLIGGLVCLFLGFTWPADAPAAAQTDEQREFWWALDNAFFWCLRVLGVVFLFAAGLAAAGTRISMLLATIAEAAFVLLMIAMSIAWTIEARVDGDFNIMVILLIIFAVLGIGGLKQSWLLYRVSGGNRPPAQQDFQSQ